MGLRLSNSRERQGRAFGHGCIKARATVRRRARRGTVRPVRRRNLMPCNASRESHAGPPPFAAEAALPHLRERTHGPRPAFVKALRVRRMQRSSAMGQISRPAGGSSLARADVPREARGGRGRTRKGSRVFVESHDGQMFRAQRPESSEIFRNTCAWASWNFTSRRSRTI